MPIDCRNLQKEFFIAAHIQAQEKVTSVPSSDVGLQQEAIDHSKNRLLGGIFCSLI
jgi:hypothetical protein